MHKGEAFQFNVMHEGYKDATRLFIKIFKPPFAYRREQGLCSVIYVDDILFGGDEFEECQANVTKTLHPWVLHSS